jgi:hypothetical protein
MSTMPLQYSCTYFFHAFNQVNPVITLNLCYMKFFVRFNTEQPTDQHGTKNYIYLTTAVSSPLNWHGPRLCVIPIATLAQLNLEWKLWKKKWEGSLEQVCMFVFVHWLQSKGLACPNINSITNILTFFLRICYQQVTCMIIYGTDDTISTYAVICSFVGNYKKWRCIRFNDYIYTKMPKHYTENNSKTSEWQFICSNSCFVSLFHNSCHYPYSCIFNGFY